MKALTGLVLTIAVLFSSALAADYSSNAIYVAKGVLEFRPAPMKLSEVPPEIKAAELRQLTALLPTDDPRITPAGVPDTQLPEIPIPNSQ